MLQYYNPHGYWGLLMFWVLQRVLQTWEGGATRSFRAFPEVVLARPGQPKRVQIVRTGTSSLTICTLDRGGEPPQCLRAKRASVSSPSGLTQSQRTGDSERRAG